MEFKYSKEACDLEALAESAVKQIFDKKYDADLEGNIIYIGLAHFGKNVKVYWKNK